MRITITIMVLCCIAACCSAETIPGTILTTTAIATYCDSSGQQMPEQTSEPENVLVVSDTPERPVMLIVRALHFGPSTVGKTIKMIGRVFRDSEGVCWFDDGSNWIEIDEFGNKIVHPLYCVVSELFLEQQATEIAGTSRVLITGISQQDGIGTPVVIPPTDANVELINP